MSLLSIRIFINCVEINFDNKPILRLKYLHSKIQNFRDPLLSSSHEAIQIINTNYHNDKDI